MDLLNYSLDWRQDTTPQTRKEQNTDFVIALAISLAFSGVVYSIKPYLPQNYTPNSPAFSDNRR